MAASAINIDAKYSHPSQQVNAYKQCWENQVISYNGDEWLEDGTMTINKDEILY